MIEDTNFSLQSNNVFSKQKLLSKVVFEEIVGSDMLNKIEHTEDLNDAEKVLKNVWKYFGSTELEDDSAANIVSSEQDEQPSHPMNISEKSTSPFQLQKNPEETYALKQQGPSSEAHKEVSQESSLKSARRQLFSIGEPSSSSSESPLAKILHWPDSPKRKGKRNVPRYPFVTSSRQWQLFHLAKENKKQEVINLKEERKLQQRKRKAEKEDKKSSKKGKETVSKLSKQSLGLCFKCASHIKSKGFNCSLCNKNYHHECLPKEFEEHLPDSDDEKDTFVCPACFQYAETDEDLNIKDICGNDSDD